MRVVYRYTDRYEAHRTGATTSRHRTVICILPPSMASSSSRDDVARELIKRWQYSSIETIIIFGSGDVVEWYSGRRLMLLLWTIVSSTPIIDYVTTSTVIYSVSKENSQLKSSVVGGHSPALPLCPGSAVAAWWQPGGPIEISQLLSPSEYLHTPYRS